MICEKGGMKKMAVSVEFFCIENKKEIKDIDEYVENVISELKTDGIIPNEAEFIKPDNDKDIEIDNVYIVDFNVANDGIDSTWQVVLEFGTFNSILQVEVFISGDNYQLTIDSTYLEALKLSIKNALKSYWSRIVWVKDDYSELLSISLYPCIYRVENLARQLINEVMSKKYGIDWWDNYIPQKIKRKHDARKTGYKSAVHAFRDVDERLMSIDIGDLRDIFFLKKKIWNPQPDNVISEYLNGHVEITNDKLKEILTDQLVENEDLWNDEFSEYLTEDFKEKFKTFELNRNHVMHNKLIDRAAYFNIKTSVDTVTEELKSAIIKSQQKIMSAEQLEDMERQHEANRIEHELIELEYMQSEAGVNILDIEEILEIFDDNLQEFHQNFKDAMRFREDVDISDCKNVINKNGELFFTIEYKITEETLDIYYEFNVLDDSQGSTSEITIYYCYNDEKNKFPVRYTNGMVEYNDHQANYMPLTNDVFYDSDIEKLMENLQDFVNENFENIRADIDASMYSIVKDGGTSPVAEDVLCWECSEEYVCINENYGTFGQCLNCGEMNEICKCSRCECYYDGIEHEDEVNFCDNCKDWFENQ